ncbi:hypothetical protein CR513_22483, partial [Mucuna pruriens]
MMKQSLPCLSLEIKESLEQSESEAAPIKMVGRERESLIVDGKIGRSFMVEIKDATESDWTRSWTGKNNK